MLIHLHSQEIITRKIRAKIQASDEPVWVLAKRCGTTEQTIWKWRKRNSVHDYLYCSSIANYFQACAGSYRSCATQFILVSLDDLLAVVREFLNPDVSRSGRDRCLPVVWRRQHA